MKDHMYLGKTFSTNYVGEMVTDIDSIQNLSMTGAFKIYTNSCGQFINTNVIDT